MKNKFISLLLLFALLFEKSAYASVGYRNNGTAVGEVTTINSKGSTISFDGSVVTVDNTIGAITSGAIDGTTVGATTPAAGSFSALAAGGLAQAANSWRYVTNGIEFEGTTADTSEMSLLSADVTADRTATLPDQTGTVLLAGVATALTAGTTVTLTVLPGKRLLTDTITTDNQDQTINASGAGSAGDEMSIIFVTDSGGSNDEVITFGTNLRSVGTLTLANAAASRYVVTFLSDGGKWNEKCRTAVQAA